MHACLEVPIEAFHFPPSKAPKTASGYVRFNLTGECRKIFGSSRTSAQTLSMHYVTRHGSCVHRLRPSVRRPPCWSSCCTAPRNGPGERALDTARGLGHQAYSPPRSIPFLQWPLGQHHSHPIQKLDVNSPPLTNNHCFMGRLDHDSGVMRQVTGYSYLKHQNSPQRLSWLGPSLFSPRRRGS